jgi:hypothetical protein
MRSLAGLLAAAALLCAVPAGAQVFGQLTPAHQIVGGDKLFGAYLQLPDGGDIGILGQLRFASGQDVNWGLQAGFIDDDSATARSRSAATCASASTIPTPSSRSTWRSTPHWA